MHRSINQHSVRERAARLLEVPVDASLSEVKRAFREKAKALHPDTREREWKPKKSQSSRADDDDAPTSTSTVSTVSTDTTITFAELREAYEILLKRVGVGGANTDADDGGSGASDVYGPGMRARFEAAKKWRERRGAPPTGPIRAASETTMPKTPAEKEERQHGFVFRQRTSTNDEGEDSKKTTTTGGDDDANETLEAILRRHKVARSSKPASAAAATAGMRRNDLFSSSSAESVMPKVVNGLRRHAASSSSAVGASGAALLCATSCVFYLLSR